MQENVADCNDTLYKHLVKHDRLMGTTVYALGAADQIKVIRVDSTAGSLGLAESLYIGAR